MTYSILMKPVFSICCFILLISCKSNSQTQDIPPAPILSSEAVLQTFEAHFFDQDFSSTIENRKVILYDILAYGTDYIVIDNISISDKATVNVSVGDSIRLDSLSTIRVIAEDSTLAQYEIQFVKGLKEYEAKDVDKEYTTPTFAHYMPWFENRMLAEFGHYRYKWGQHWTMANINPNLIRADGKQRIASHYYPLVGPYDNGEDEYLEYAVVCMKLAGLDGILIDNAGTTPVYDGKLLLDHTNAILPWLEKAGLEFGIVYEDASLQNAINENVINDKVEEAKKVFGYFEDNYFSRDNYLKLNERPVILNFGPQALTRGSQWNEVFSTLENPIHFIPLPYRNLGSAASGEFAWVDDSANNNFYNRALQNNWNITIGGAFPGFNDYYKEGGWGDGYTFYDDLSGAFFMMCLDRAKAANIDLLQIITWNDFGEGTIIEPTYEFGYFRLTQLQNFLGVDKLGEKDLALTVDLYKKRKAYKEDAEVNLLLDQVFNYLIALKTEEAAYLLAQIELE